MRKLGWFSLGFFAALAICAWLIKAPWGFVPGAVCVLAFGILLLAKRGWSVAALAALGLAAGFCWFSAYDLLFAAPVRDFSGRTISAEAVARDDAQPSNYGQSVYADAVIEGRRARVLLYFSDEAAVRPGDRVTFTAKLRAPEDDDLYYRSIGVSLVGSVRRGTLCVQEGRQTLRTLPLRLRRLLKDQIRAVFPEDAAPFITALLTGDRSGLSYAEKNDLSVSGIAHIVAISGMHVSILLGLISLLLGNRRRLTALLGIPTVVLFTLMTGAVPSVVRACVMQIVWLMAPLLRRENDPPTSLGLAALCVLIPNPWAVANLSFQLSFGAMAGLQLLSGAVYRKITDWPPVHRALRRRFARPITKYTAATVAATCGALIFTLPLTAARLGVVSLAALGANLLALWAVSLLFELSLLACLLGAVWLAPAKLVGLACTLLVRHILGVAGLMAGLPFTAVYTQNAFILPWLIFSYLVFACCFLPGGRKAVLPAACACALGLCLSLWLGWLDGGSRDLQMTMLDVGQGQCLVFTNGGAALMYDCGGTGDEKAGETAARYLLSRGASRLDVLVLSHYDRDHAGGVCQLLERIDVDFLYLPDIPDDSGTRADIEKCAADHGIATSYVNQDLKLSFQGGTARLFAPVTDGSDNEASVAMLLSQGEFDILATGDMPAGAERLLLSRRRLPDIEVLVAGHHGAKSSTCDTLLAQTTPETVLISVGKNNSYGHPAEETIARIEDSGAQILRTDECGNITVRRG